jgi:hypothetical protein
MASGGARARSGPAPDPEALNRLRGTDAAWHVLPLTGRPGPPPKWPHPEPVRARARAVGEALGQAAGDPLGSPRPGRRGGALRAPVRRAEQPDAPVATVVVVRQLGEALGLTIPGLLRNRWQIGSQQSAPAPMTQAPTGTSGPTTSRSSRATGSRSSAMTTERVVNFPTLFIVPDWIERHCPQPDRFGRGGEFRLYDTQLWWTLNHYRVKPTAVWRPENPILAPAFHNRRSQIIAPQKVGKGPWSAAICLAEGGGPVLFAGWAAEGDVYRCADNDCGCGWVYGYAPGEPKGMRWPTPLIQITATSEDQTDNIYRHVKAMIRLGPLSGLMHVGESMVRIGAEGEIDTVTTGALSKLGNPVTFAMQDETGLYTDTNKLRKVAETQRRGAAGMGGRSMETTNCYDPSEDSVAQRTHESRPRTCSGSMSRRRELVVPQQARAAEDPRVQLRRLSAQRHRLDRRRGGRARREGPGAGRAVLRQQARVRRRHLARGRQVGGPESERPPVLDGAAIVLGFDGSDTDDWTAIRPRPSTATSSPRPTATTSCRRSGIRPSTRTRCPASRSPRRSRSFSSGSRWSGCTRTRRTGRPRSTPGSPGVRREGRAALGDLPAHADARRVPAAAHRRREGGLTVHARRQPDDVHARQERPQAGRPNKRYVLGKPSQTQKIDAAVTSILCHEAAGDVTAKELWPKPAKKRRVVVS